MVQKLKINYIIWTMKTYEVLSLKWSVIRLANQREEHWRLNNINFI